ncbi:hypothetical protein [Nitrobacter sp. JJSN]|uniref:hypothetical protein n=1 Tax=Nitrobacter sp. JJSN TaxID=3453033 RepID=UPI003F76D530
MISFRTIWVVFKASYRQRRIMGPNEITSLLKTHSLREEKKLFYRAIGLVSVSWCQIEILFDYANLFLINTYDMKETQLPIALKPKIAFFRKHFQTIPELDPFKDRAMAIVERANILKEARHDIIHGYAAKLVSVDDDRRFVRHDYRGKRIAEKTKSYSLDQIIQKSEEMGELVDLMVALLRQTIPPNKILSNYFDDPLS